MNGELASCRASAAPLFAMSTQRLVELAAKHKALGYPMLHGMLKSEGLVVNMKQTYRVYSEERLQLRQRNKKKLDRPRMPGVYNAAAKPQSKVGVVFAPFSKNMTTCFGRAESDY